MSQSFTRISDHSDNGIKTIEIITEPINDFDLAHATTDEIDNAFDGSHSNKAVIDLKNTKFISSVGLVVFSRLLATIRQLDARIVLYNASDQLVEVLETTRLVSLAEQRISFATNLDAALPCIK